MVQLIYYTKLGGHNMDNSVKLRKILEQNNFFSLPGVYDPMGAKMAEKIGFEAAYLSGGALSLMGLGRPDIGFLNLTDLIISLERILYTVDIPIITDTDNSFGNALHAAKTANALQRMGVAGLQIDDNVLPPAKPIASKEYITWDLLAPKLEAIRMSTSDSFVIVLRTIIGKSLGIDSAVERANHAADLGVDYVFIEGLNSIEEMEYACNNSRAKLMVNLNENVFAASVDIGLVKKMGFKIGLFPISTMHIAAKAMYEVLSMIKNEGTAYSMKNQMMSFTDLMELLEFNTDSNKYLELYK